MSAGKAPDRLWFSPKDERIDYSSITASSSAEQYVRADLFIKLTTRANKLEELVDITAMEARGGCGCHHCKFVRTKLAELDGEEHQDEQG